MPQATNWSDIYRIEDYVEAAAKSILAARSVASGIYTSRDEAEKVTPRVNLQLTITGTPERYGFRASDNQPFLDMWDARLTAEIVTRRSTNNSQHALIRAKCRQYLRLWSLYNADELLPYHAIARVLDESTTPSVVTEDDLDISAVSFVVVVTVRPEAWPDADIAV